MAGDRALMRICVVRIASCVGGNCAKGDESADGRRSLSGKPTEKIERA